MANPLQPRKKSIFAPWVQEIPGVLGDAGDFLGKAGRTANAMYGPGAYGPGAMDYLGFKPTPQPEQPNMAFGEEGIPESPNPGFGLPGLPGFAKPWVQGQANYLEKNDTDTRGKPATIGKFDRERFETAKQGQPHRDNPLTPGNPPMGPEQDHATGSGLTSEPYFPVDRPSLFDSIGINEQGQSRRDPDSYVRVKFPGSDQWMEQAPREPSDSRGHSEMDWSKVANPMAFSEYRNRGKRKLMDMQAEDPYVGERIKAEAEERKAAAPALIREQSRRQTGKEYEANAERDMTMAANQLREIRKKYGDDPANAEKRQRAEEEVKAVLRDQLNMHETASGFRRETANSKDGG